MLLVANYINGAQPCCADPHPSITVLKGGANSVGRGEAEIAGFDKLTVGHLLAMRLTRISAEPSCRTRIMSIAQPDRLGAGEDLMCKPMSACGGTCHVL